MDGRAWWAAVHGVAKSQTGLSDFTFTFHFHALEKEMAAHSSVLAWRISGTGEPGGLPSLGSQSRTRLKWLSSMVLCWWLTERQKDEVGHLKIELKKKISVVHLQCCVTFCCTAKWFSYTYIHILFCILFHYDVSQDIEYSSLCSTVGCCLSILYMLVCTC